MENVENGANAKNSKVLLISIDNLRYDCASYVEDKPHLKQFYLEKLPDTPTLDEIASNSAVFTNFFSTSTYTTAAHASLFTGLYQQRHGVRPFFYKKLNKDCVTLADVYKKNGYKTVLYSDVIELFHPIGLTKGFDYVFAGDISELYKQLEGLKNEKVFCFMHLFDAHEPYIYSQNYNENHYNDDYFDFIKKMSLLFKIPMTNNDPFALWNNFSSKVNFWEHVMLPAYIYGINKFDKGRFRLIYNSLKSLGYFDEEAIYSILADHGEGRITLFDQPVFGHMGELYDEVTHVPLILHAPQVEKKAYGKIASIVDVFKTLITLSGLDADIVSHDNKTGPAQPPSQSSGAGETLGLSGIDGVSLFDEREYCYSEFCTQNMYNEIMQFAAPEYNRQNNGASAKDRYFLSQRAIRTADKKYLFIPENIPHEEAKKIIENVKLSEEDFVIAMFNFVMRKRISRQEYFTLLNALKAKTATRTDIYKNLTSSDIYRRVKNYYYDLAADPLEEMPLPLNMALTSTQKYVEILNKIESGAVVTENLFDENIPAPAPVAANGAGAAKDEKNAGARTGGAAIIQPEFNAVGDAAGDALTIELLHQKIALSTEIIKEARERFGDSIGIAFTGGKDSSVMLDLVRKAFDGKIPFKVITIDTSAEFKEIKDFIEKLKRDWGFELLTYSNKEALKANYPIAKDKADCCLTLKTSPLKMSIKDLHLKAMMTGIRRDETESRANEAYFSKRKDPHHFRVHPILHFTEKDIWDYIKLNNLPFCPLYNEGYRSIDCAPCTSKTPKEGVAERSGRSEDKEAAMAKLRQLGYF